MHSIQLTNTKMKRLENFDFPCIFYIVIKPGLDAKKLLNFGFNSSFCSPTTGDEASFSTLEGFVHKTMGALHDRMDALADSTHNAMAAVLDRFLGLSSRVDAMETQTLDPRGLCSNSDLSKMSPSELNAVLQCELLKSMRK